MQVSIHASPDCLLTHVNVWNHSTRLRLGFDWISMDDGWQRCNCSVRQDHGRACTRAEFQSSPDMLLICWSIFDLDLLNPFDHFWLPHVFHTFCLCVSLRSHQENCHFHHGLQLVIEYRTWIQACPSVMAICALGGTAPGTTVKDNPWCGKIASQTCAFVRSLHHHSTPLMTATCAPSTAQDLLAFFCLYSTHPWFLWKHGCKPIICKRLRMVPMSQCDWF